MVRTLFALALLLTASCSSSRSGPPNSVRLKPPSPVSLEKAALHDLVEIRYFTPDIVIDLRYAGRDNVARHPVYPREMPCLLRQRTALKLQHAQSILRTQGYGLKVWDAWRPPEAQVWLHNQAENPDLFLDPKEFWSLHCAGAAVDVTLVDLKGREVQMPTAHDETSPHTGYNYKGGNPEIAKNVFILQSAMVRAGFQILPTEWWHFDDAFYIQHPIPIVSASQIDVQLNIHP